MQIMIDKKDLSRVAIIINDGWQIETLQDALDLMATVKYEGEAYKAVLFQDQFPPEFFDLRTGFAGEILQKFTNYQFQIAIVGDFSQYESKSLKDFIYESNQGHQVYFAPDLITALAAMHKLP